LEFGIWNLEMNGSGNGVTVIFLQLFPLVADLLESI